MHLNPPFLPTFDSKMEVFRQTAVIAHFRTDLHQDKLTENNK